jgi:hypothetical protein
VPKDDYNFRHRDRWKINAALSLTEAIELVKAMPQWERTAFVIALAAWIAERLA